MKIFFILLILSISLFAKENYNYIIKFAKYDKNKISNYNKDYKLKKYFTSDNKILFLLKERGEKLSNVKLTDLRVYFRAELKKEEFLELKNDKFIKNIYKAPVMVKRPSIDIEPKTGLFTQIQNYLYSFEEESGINAPYGWQFKGGAGKNVTVVDNEGGWILDHEDLDLSDAIIYDKNGVNLSGTQYNEPTFYNHGTSVVGEIASRRNDYGTTGIAFNTNIKITLDWSQEYEYSNADAIIRVLPQLKDGDIMLLESQMGGPNYNDATDHDTQNGLVPDEWYDAEFDAIKTATANNIIIIEAGANGGEDLDDALFSSCDGDSNKDPLKGKNGFAGDPCFNLKTRDSGAIIVGAAYSPDTGTPLERFEYSSAGGRVDVQAWGSSITTTGYGDLFYPNSDNKQSYTLQFGGTSGASPIITAIVAQLQSRYKEKNNGQFLTPKEIRAILKDPKNSHPQSGGLHIGPQPDVKLIFENVLNDTSPCNNECKTSCVFGECECEKNTDCNKNQLCNEKNKCEISPCIPVCNDWSYCDKSIKECKLHNKRCNDKYDCNEFSFCNSEHFCEKKPICGGIRCDNLEICSNQQCECISGYYRDKKSNKCVEPKKEKSTSCNYSQSKINLILPFLLFFIIFIKKRKINKL